MSTLESSSAASTGRCRKDNQGSRRGSKHAERRSPGTEARQLSKENEYLPPVGKVYTKCRSLVLMDEQNLEEESLNLMFSVESDVIVGGLG